MIIIITTTIIIIIIIIMIKIIIIIFIIVIIIRIQCHKMIMMITITITFYYNEIRRLESATNQRRAGRRDHDASANSLHSAALDDATPRDRDSSWCCRPLLFTKQTVYRQHPSELKLIDYCLLSVHYFVFQALCREK